MNKKLKISMDFDSTLSRKDIQKYAKELIEDHYKGRKTWTSAKSGNPEDDTRELCSARDYIIAELNDDYHYAFDQI